MSRTESTMLPLGTLLPSFDLPIVNRPNLLGRNESNDLALEKLTDKNFIKRPLLIMIICAHCPFVKHIELEITRLHKGYGKNVDFLAVSCNSLLTHPQDGPDHLRRQAELNDWLFPYLFDYEQEFTKLLKASCTPDFFLFTPLLDCKQKLFYRGQLDSSRPGNDIPLTGNDLRIAMDAVLQKRNIYFEQKPSIGCNIKWHPGNEPSWFD